MKRGPQAESVYMKDNEQLKQLIESLKTEKKGFWKKVAYELNAPRRKRAQVNVSKLDAYGEDGLVFLVPGKVLGSGNVTKKLIVAAFSFSDSAKKLIEATGGKTMSINDLLKSNKDGKDVVILK